MQNDEKKVKRSFFQGMKAELKKVIWPTGKQTVKSTFITIGFVLLISAILIVLNLFFSFLSTKWYNLILDNDNQSHVNQIISGDTNKNTNIEANDSGESGDVESSITSGEDTSIVE